MQVANFAYSKSTIISFICLIIDESRRVQLVKDNRTSLIDINLFSFFNSFPTVTEDWKLENASPNQKQKQIFPSL